MLQFFLCGIVAHENVENAIKLSRDDDECVSG
jgi:hypothetical protein